MWQCKAKPVCWGLLAVALACVPGCYSGISGAGASDEEQEVPGDGRGELSFDSPLGKMAWGVLSVRCGQCHADEPGLGGITGILDLERLLETGLVVSGDPDHSPLFRAVDEERMPQGVPLDDFERHVLQQWIAGYQELEPGSRPGCFAVDEAVAAVAPRRIWRLTHEQYGRSVRALLGLQSTPEDSLRADAQTGDFGNDASVLSVDGNLFFQYQRTAQAVAAEAVGDLSSLWPCPTYDPDDRACAETFITSFAPTALRRPLQAQRVAALLALYDEGSMQTQGRDGRRGLQMAIEALLLSPYFLFRTEIGPEDPELAVGTVVDPSAHEVATQLAFTLWDQTPDPALMRAADDGSILQPEAFAQHVDRMLDDSRGRAFFGRFVMDWLDIELLDTVDKTDPDFDDTLRADLAEEIVQFANNVIADGGTINTLFSAEYTYANERLAQAIYATGVDGEGFQRLALDGNRAGLLSLPGFLATFSPPLGPAHIKRGQVVREKLLCQPIPDPPDLPEEDNADPPEGSEDWTSRERFTFEHLERASSCAGCHNLIDPIGFSLGRFDELGRYVETEVTRSGLEVETDVATEMRFTRDPAATGEFSGGRGLAERIVGTEDLYQCGSRQVFRYVFGRHATAQDRCEIGHRAHGFTESEGDLRQLLRDYLRSELVTKRQVQ